jgi:hypothetical protein
MTKQEYGLLNDFYNNLADEESRYIFRKRLLYLFTGDLKYLKEMTMEVNALFHPSKRILSIEYAGCVGGGGGNFIWRWTRTA